MDRFEQQELCKQVLLRYHGPICCVRPSVRQVKADRGGLLAFDDHILTNQLTSAASDATIRSIQIDLNSKNCANRCCCKVLAGYVVCGKAVRADNWGLLAFR